MSSTREPASNSSSAASGGVDLRLPHRHVGQQVGRIERGNLLPLLDHHAFIHQPLLDAAGDLEGHLGLGGLDVAGDANLSVRLAAVDWRSSQ